jgi:hypothetical protein
VRNIGFEHYYILEKECYFRFLYMAVVSFMLLTNVKFASINCPSSSKLWLTLCVHSSVSAKYNACSMFMYIMVLSIFLCPKTYFTCMMSLVLWYSIVPLKCLSVWNDICFSLSF